MNSLRVADVSVIIVNYNGAEVLAEAIDSVLALEPSPLELIVLDNGSTDQSPAIIDRYSRNDARVRPIMAGENLGVAGGRNLGASYADGQALAFLDADGRATETWLASAVNCLNRFPRAGAVAPLVLTEGGQTINGAGSFLDPNGHGRDRLWGEPLIQHQEEIAGWAGQCVDYPMGCGMVIRVAGLEEIWPLDDRLPKWHDDTELGIRIRRMGYETIFWPESVVLHIGGHSDPASHYERHWLGEEARLRLLIKYYAWTRVLANVASLWMHGISGRRTRPEVYGEVLEVFGRVRRHLDDVLTIRQEWQRMRKG